MDAGITAERLERVMAGNALRFFGLGAGEATLTRLTRFYAEAGRPLDRLPLAASSRSISAAAAAGFRSFAPEMKKT